MKAATNSLVKKEQAQSFSAFITSQSVSNRINSLVADKREGAQFITAITSAVTANPMLQNCTHMSILNCALLGQSLKLSPSPTLGQYYMVPFNDKVQGYLAQFILGYKGYIQLAIRSGYYRKLNVLPIKEGELVRYNPLEEEIEVDLMQDEVEREKAQTVGYFAMFEYHNGFRKTLYWTREKMEAHAKKYSAGYQNDLEKGKDHTFWSQDFDGMACKTMLRQLISKWGIMSVELQTALDADVGGERTLDNEGFTAAPVQTTVAAQEADAGDFFRDGDAQ